MAGVEIPRDGVVGAGAEGNDGAVPNLEDVLALPAHHAPDNGGNAHATIAGPGFTIDEALEGPPLRTSEVGPFFIFF